MVMRPFSSGRLSLPCLNTAHLSPHVQCQSQCVADDDDDTQTMAGPAPSTSNNNTSRENTATPYALSLLVEYAHILDAAPLELSRSFADLRELDAVLSVSMASLREKANRLIAIIENKAPVPSDERLWLLAEIAEEAIRLKLGGDDKVRAATQAVDNLQSHIMHMNNLAAQIPSDEPFIQERDTKYPYVASHVPAFAGGVHEPGRRRRAGNAGGLLASTGAGDGHSGKRKRLVVDTTTAVDYGLGNGGGGGGAAVNKSPFKERTTVVGDGYYPAGVARPARNGTHRTKKCVFFMCLKLSVFNLSLFYQSG